MRWLGPGAQLGADEDKPDGLGKPDGGHAVDVEVQVAGGDGSDDEHRDEATVDGDGAAEAGVA